MVLMREESSGRENLAVSFVDLPLGAVRYAGSVILTDKFKMVSERMGTAAALEIFFQLCGV
jgi:hypothetical protein